MFGRTAGVAQTTTQQCKSYRVKYISSEGGNDECQRDRMKIVSFVDCSREGSSQEPASGNASVELSMP